jgi:SNF2 family DNA or RNA helicase
MFDVNDADMDEDSLCVICQCEVEMAGVTPCARMFCLDCIMKYIEQGRPEYPVCRHPVQAKDIVEVDNTLNQKQSDIMDGVIGDFGTKISAVIYDMRTAKDPKTKMVVFSHWKMMLTYVKSALSQNAIKYADFTGKNEERMEMLAKINHDPETRVILVAMRTKEGAAGLTLTSCNVSYLLEPSVNPGLEDQAISRIYRIGQTRPATAVRLIVKQSIEPKIRASAEAKRSSARDLKEDETLKFAELLDLFDLTPKEVDITNDDLAQTFELNLGASNCIGVKTKRKRTRRDEWR